MNIVKYSSLKMYKWKLCLHPSQVFSCRALCKNHSLKLSYPPVCSYHSDRGTYGFRPTAQPDVLGFKIDPSILELRNEHPNIFRFISAFREFGHLKANINPLAANHREVPELDPSFYGISNESRVSVKGLVQVPQETMSVDELRERLMKIYCGEIGVEFMYLPTQAEREWFAHQIEEVYTTEVTDEEKRVIGEDLLKSQLWDNFLAVKFQSVKRYGAEGAETMMTFFRETFKLLSENGVEEVVFANSHRGRLNLLTLLLGIDPQVFFRKLRGLPEYPEGTQGVGDVVSHFIASSDLDFGGARPLHVTMLYNPSHLEAADPVACGKTRARQKRLRDGHYSDEGAAVVGDKVVCLQVHGDAALAGQGVVQETLAMSQVPHFAIGGSIHMCVNNQVGYTTPAARGRSSLYSTDVAKMGSFPVVHVNGDNPEAVLKATRLAVTYNRRFRRDVFVDLVCWRRWGHNELDDPKFTNPGMYSIIDNRRSVPDSYCSSLVDAGVWTPEEMESTASSYSGLLNSKLRVTDSFEPSKPHLQKHWGGMVEAPDTIEVWDTGVDVATLKHLGAKSVEVPEGFNLHPNLRKSLVTSRLEKLTSGVNVDWATAESLAFASLMHEGFDVRLSGQDVGRGTFSQRHCMLVDQCTDEILVPLNHVSPHQEGFLEVANSILSEEGVLGFEYGMSIESPTTLCVWEAQFGDFFNGAQIILDTFVSSGEEKWLTQSGLVLLLPHGFDGAGPEHSSCRLERFLQGARSSEDSPDSERVNWNVINPTTAAQIFHALRRQMVRNYRKPLVVVGPKSILRLPAAFSSLGEMAPGTHFQNVIGDPEVKPEDVRRIVFVSGKHFYLLKTERDRRNRKDVALVRVESLCPFPTRDINAHLSKYTKVKDFVWSQEEHRNMGAWRFVEPRFRNLCATQLKYAGRRESGTVAVGVGVTHQRQIQEVLQETFDF